MSHGGAPKAARPTPTAVSASSGYDIADADRSSSSHFHHTSQLSDDFSLGSPLSPPDSAHVQDGLLQDSLFPEWRNAAPRDGVESPDEMQRKDPLATQIWKLYSRTKAQLPNQERMENLTWRMMAMSLKRKERERLQQNNRYVYDNSGAWTIAFFEVRLDSSSLVYNIVLRRRTVAARSRAVLPNSVRPTALPLHGHQHPPILPPTL